MSHGIYPLFSTALKAYSTWNTRPSGENWEADKSYCKENISHLLHYLYFTKSKNVMKYYHRL